MMTAQPIEEQWKTISFDSRYEVSSQGNVRRKAEKYTVGGHIKILPERQIKQFEYGGYLYVNFDNKSYSVSRLVATEFVPNPENLNIVIFLDGDSFNVSADNLAWTSRSDNMKKCRNSKYYKQSKGKSVSVYCTETKTWYPNIKKALNEIECQLNISIKYDTMLRHINEDSSTEDSVKGIHLYKKYEVIT